MVEVRLEGTHKLTIQIPSIVKLRPLAVEGNQHERLRAIAPERPLPMLLHPVLNLPCHAFLTPEFQIDSKYACIESGILVAKEIAVSVHGERRAGNGGWRVRDGGWGVGDGGWGRGKYHITYTCTVRRPSPLPVSTYLCSNNVLAAAENTSPYDGVLLYNQFKTQMGKMKVGTHTMVL